MRFQTCRNCEHRWWTDLHGNDVVPLSDVLAHVVPRGAAS